MSGNDKYDNDDYVAKLLAEDAKRSSQRYASTGLSALLPKRSTKAAPKPNTRFLTHLVREVDSHNAALKKKEELEARIRLREIKERDSRDQDRRDSGRERKRRRTDEQSKQYHRHDRERDRSRSRSPREHKDDTGKRRKRASQSHREWRRHRSRSTSPQREEVTDKSRGKQQDRTYHTYREQRLHHIQSHRSPTSSPDRTLSRSKHSSRRHKRSTSPRPRPRSRSPTPRSGDSSPDSSDPLESVLNPKPQPQIRGRGGQLSTNPALKSTSNIDRHFSTTYDPNLDIHSSVSPSASPGPDQDRSDWDLALSALRDRTKWKKTQAQRLRDAGFGDEEIRKWEKQAAPGDGKDGDIRDVKWAKRGEAREWDLGKKGVGHGLDG